MNVDLKNLALEVLEIAKGNLRKDGCLMPVAFLVTRQGIETLGLQ